MSRTPTWKGVNVAASRKGEHTIMVPHRRLEQRGERLRLFARCDEFPHANSPVTNG